MTEKVDGRSHRWHDHRVTRRRELLDCTLAAIRRHGHGIGMNEIAAANHVSKTVLYKHFVDKKGLADAAMAHTSRLRWYLGSGTRSPGISTNTTSPVP